ncbi:MAG TPA: AMP-binding protein, partial [Solirubrobacteraceae bacterium]|nr:AMP-binding protein [Solirubrobacteraceae bacterium]
MADTDEQDPLWKPSAEQMATARMTHFMGWAGARHAREFADYDALWQWSIDELEEFWGDVWEYCGVCASAPYERVLARAEMPGANWFEGTRLNYAENLLRRKLDAPGLLAGRSEVPSTSDRWRSGCVPRMGYRSRIGDDERDARANRTAVLHASELRALGELSWGELTEQVAAAAAGLRALGVQRGDRVAAYMPNIPETLVAFLATASIGAIWSCAAPEFGASSVIDRFAQIEPKVLLVVDGYRHGGKDFDRTDALKSILGGLPSVEHAVLLGYLDESAAPDGLLSDQAGQASDRRSPGVPGIEGRSSFGALSWSDLLALGSPGGVAAELAFEQVPFDHPLWVLYSSGTTGLPKAI